MSGSSIESAAVWVGKLLVEEVQFLWQVRDKIEELQNELEWMQCFLSDADDKQNKNAVIRKWVSEIADLAQESEDVIETYILKVSHKREEARGLIPWSNLKWLLFFWRDCITMHNVGCEIDALTSKISKLSSRLQTYGIKSSYDASSSYLRTQRTLQEQRQTQPDTKDDVVGLDECIKDVVGKLVTGQEKVVVIHGMGGIGKTTLAREVYHHGKLKDRFDGFAWAYVSQQLQLASVCRHILLQLIPKKDEKERNSIEKLTDLELPSKLNQVLRRKKCLVVLDDIWSASDWKRLENAFAPFNEDNCGSKLLLTTRNLQILQSKISHPLVYCHQAKCLEHGQSWKLFEKKANFNKDTAESWKVDLGNKLLSHCNGNPLAIVVLGGVLATKKTYDEWQSVYDNLYSHLHGEELHSGVYEVLAMSYYELPYNLKPCFLYFGVFPEDFEIHTERLFHLWIAEGIVPSTQTQVRGKGSVQEIAEVLLNQLVERGLVQVITRHSDGHIVACKLHDLMRDICLELAKEENFLQVVDPYVGNNNIVEQQILPNYALCKRLRRLAIHVRHQDGIRTSLPNSSSSKKMSCLRSLLFFPTDEAQVEDCKWVNKVFEDYPLLRILDLIGMPLSGRLPSCVGTLIYLRYLSLRGTRITELPSSIRYLRLLLILDLRVRDTVIILPNVFSNLKSLRQLYFPCRSFYLHSLETGYKIKDDKKLSLNNLSNLEMIEDVELDGVDVKGLLELKAMKKLAASCVYKKESLDPFLKSSSIKTMSLKIRAEILAEHPATLCGSHYLRSLHIDDEKDGGHQLPKTLLEEFPQNLVDLGFWYCKISEDFIPVLEKLPWLKKLELHLCYLGRKLHFTSKGFPELTHLIIDGFWYLNEWTVEDGGLPKLKKLEIYSCQIGTLPAILSPEKVSIACRPCVPGIARYGSCPFYKNKFSVFK